ncbi:MAG: hypothetical protein ACD_21C00030G0004 [uncultured bacterium]|nr:MAG: hypothetical protein ACD_21C00030G0004 [uncultured bacterium]HBY55928.1 hypothetical protein [Coxiellaceae bacterium]
MKTIARYKLALFVSFIIFMITCILLLNVNFEEKWVLISQHACFSPRDSAAGFKFNSKLWLSSGYVSSDKEGLRDLFVSSDDGISWSVVLQDIPYKPYSPIVVKDGKSWAVFDKVWYSNDGFKWFKISESTPWHNFVIGDLVVFKDFLVYTVDGFLWRSKDGKKWEKYTLPFVKYAGQLVVFKKKILYVGGALVEKDGKHDSGGVYKNYSTTDASIWASDDCINWELIASNPGWEPRMWPGVIVHKNMLWLYGGFSNLKRKNFNDLWYSKDGINWKYRAIISDDPNPSPRHASTIYSTKHGILLVAGNSWPVLNDVWLYKRFFFIEAFGRKVYFKQIIDRISRILKA